MKKRTKVVLGVAAVAIAIGVIASANGGGEGSTVTPASPEVSEKAEYVLTATSPGGFTNVTYIRPDGQMSQETSPAGTEWSATVDGNGWGKPTLTVQGGSGTGEVACRITHDGKVVAENSSAGAYAVVSCSAH